MEDRDPLFSIVVTTYEREGTLGRTLDSILAQREESWECLIVDDRSTDGTVSVIRDYAHRDSRIREIPKPNERPQGPAASRNVGYEASIGKYVQFFDSDDVMEVECLERVRGMLSTCPGVELIFMAYEDIVVRNGQEMGRKLNLPDFDRERGYEELMRKEKIIQTACAVWSRSFLEKLGRVFDESLFKPEDFELYARALAREPEIATIREPGYQLIQTEHGIMGEFIRGNARMLTDTIRSRRLALREGRRSGKATAEVRAFLRSFAFQHFKQSLRNRNATAGSQALCLGVECLLP